MDNDKSANGGEAAKRPRLEEGNTDCQAGSSCSDASNGNAVTKRAPFGSDHSFVRQGGKFHLLIGVTGSVATIKLAELITELHKLSPPNRLVVRVMTTEAAKHFIDFSSLEQPVYDDADEWNMWKKRGDPVLHIELRKWADGLLIAPLDANSMAKIANGICDNLLTSVVRAWDQRKPVYFAPAMNTAMWENALTYQHRKTLKDLLRFKEIPPIEKVLMCGDSGCGAMAAVHMIASIVSSEVKNRFSVYSDSSQ